MDGKKYGLEQIRTIPSIDTQMPCVMKNDQNHFLHGCVKETSDKIAVLLKIFWNKATSNCFVNLSPIFTLFSILVNNNVVHITHHFGCNGNHFGGNLCVIIVTKLLCY